MTLINRGFEMLSIHEEPVPSAPEASHRERSFAQGFEEDHLDAWAPPAERLAAALALHEAVGAPADERGPSTLSTGEQEIALLRCAHAACARAIEAGLPDVDALLRAQAALARNEARFGDPARALALAEEALQRSRDATALRRLDVLDAVRIARGVAGELPLAIEAAEEALRLQLPGEPLARASALCALAGARMAAGLDPSEALLDALTTVRALPSAADPATPAGWRLLAIRERIAAYEFGSGPLHGRSALFANLQTLLDAHARWPERADFTRALARTHELLARDEPPRISNPRLAGSQALRRTLLALDPSCPALEREAIRAALLHASSEGTAGRGGSIGEAEAWARARLERRPLDPVARRDLAVVLAHVATGRRAKLAELRAPLEESLALHRSLAVTQLESRLDVALTLERIGDAWIAGGEVDKGDGLRREAADGLRALCAACPDDPAPLRELIRLLDPDSQPGRFGRGGRASLADLRELVPLEGELERLCPQDRRSASCVVRRLAELASAAIAAGALGEAEGATIEARRRLEAKRERHGAIARRVERLEVQLALLQRRPYVVLGRLRAEVDSDEASSRRDEMRRWLGEPPRAEATPELALAELLDGQVQAAVARLERWVVACDALVANRATLFKPPPAKLIEARLLLAHALRAAGDVVRAEAVEALAPPLVHNEDPASATRASRVAKAREDAAQEAFEAERFAIAALLREAARRGRG